MIRLNRLIVIIALVTFSMGIYCCQSSNESTISIKINNSTFEPLELTIAEGTAVTWINNDPVEHVLTGLNSLPNSEVLKQGYMLNYTFTKSGTYRYYLDDHPEIKSEIIVNPAHGMEDGARQIDSRRMLHATLDIMLSDAVNKELEKHVNNTLN